MAGMIDIGIGLFILVFIFVVLYKVFGRVIKNIFGKIGIDLTPDLKLDKDRLVELKKIEEDAYFDRAKELARKRGSDRADRKFS